MNDDDTRKLLKVFGVAVTDAEAEAERVAGTAAHLHPAPARKRSPSSSKMPAICARSLTPAGSKSPSGSSPSRTRLQTHLSEAAVKWSGTSSP